MFSLELVIAYGNRTSDPRDRSPKQDPLVEQLPFKQRVQGSSPCAPTNLSMDENLATNLMYGAAVCRLCYYRKAKALPEAGDIEGQGQYWKTHYNTPLGKGMVTKYVYKVQKILKAD